MSPVVRAVLRVSALLAVVSASSFASAQATRTWVSGVGDDANPCSRTAPCKTFAGAISKTAAHGEINVLDPGGFGAVTITKSITIEGSGGSISGVLVSGTNAIIINLPGATDRVTLRNLEIHGVASGPNNALNGIYMLSQGSLIVENTRIYGFSQGGIVVENTSGNANIHVDQARISDSATAINVNPNGAAPNTGTATLWLSNSTIVQNTTGLANSATGAIVSFNNNRIAGNGSDGNPTQTIYTR